GEELWVGASVAVGAPLDAEGAIGRAAGRGREDAVATAAGVEIIPVREDRLVEGANGQGTIREGGGGRAERRGAVGGGVGDRVAHAVEGEGEGQHDCGDAVVAVVADVRCPRAGAPVASDAVVAEGVGARAGGGGRRGRRGEGRRRAEERG